MSADTEKRPDKEPQHPIQVVAKRTGLSADVIRAWERRYQAVTPFRSPTNRRLYTDADVARLELLRRATAAGRRIGDVSSMAGAELQELVSDDEAAATRVQNRGSSRRTDDVDGAFLEHALAAIVELDAERLETALSSASVSLSSPDLIEGVLAPLLVEVGDRWRDGKLRVAHEHLATATVRSFVASMLESRRGERSDATILVTTPAGQVHEMGALLAAFASSLDGWQVTYLGPNLPAEEIAAAARQLNVKAVALSIVFPVDDPRLSHELSRLRRLLSPHVAILVGGHGAESYDEAIRSSGATRVAGLSELRETLDAVRLTPGP